jgi:hypothetical protein
VWNGERCGAISGRVRRSRSFLDVPCIYAISVYCCTYADVFGIAREIAIFVFVVCFNCCRTAGCRLNERLPMSERYATPVQALSLSLFVIVVMRHVGWQLRVVLAAL